MNEPDHDTVVRTSFAQQVGLFAGDDALFARRPDSALAWLGPLDPQMMVLDAACGAAHVAEQTAPFVHQVVGVDLTPALLRLGAERLGRSGIANVLLLEGNATRLPFVDASFDLAFCRSAAHHFPHPEQLIAEMARVCRPGGRVVISDLVAPSAEVREAFDAVHRLLDPSHAGALLAPELAELVRARVGPLDSCQTSGPSSFPVSAILTDAADRDAVMAALGAELAGGSVTGFEPVLQDGEVQVSFSSMVVQATRPPG